MPIIDPQSGFTPPLPEDFLEAIIQARRQGSPAPPPPGAPGVDLTGGTGGKGIRRPGTPGLRPPPTPTTTTAAPAPAPPPPAAPEPKPSVARPRGGGGLGSAVTQALAQPPSIPPVRLPRSGLSAEQRAFNRAIRDRILAALGAASEVPTIDDPVLGPQQDAFELAHQRAFERFQRENAERAASLGLLDSGARNVELEGFQQAQGEAQAANAASLVAGELERRRNELQNLLGMAAQIGDADLQRDLTQRLAVMNAELERALGLEQLTTARLLGLGGLQLDAQDLALRRELGLGGLDLGFSQLGEQARQFDLGQVILQALLAGG